MTRDLVTAILTISNWSVNYYSWVAPSRNSGTYFGHLGHLSGADPENSERGGRYVEIDSNHLLSIKVPKAYLDKVVCCAQFIIYYRYEVK